MINKEILKKKIIYRSTHRGSKEMDLLLGNFVKRYIDNLNEQDLKDLHQLLLIEDDIIFGWYFEKEKTNVIKNNKISQMLKAYNL